MSTRSTPLLSKIRPAKVSSALHRRWFEWQLGRTPVSGRGDPVELGSSYGGWMVPRAMIEPGWTCYCVGAGGDISFDLELIREFDVRVRCIEPDEAYVASAVEVANGETRFSAHRVAIAAKDGPLRMQHTHHPGSRSLSSAGLYDTHDFVEVPGRTLQSLAAELGDESIDLLKLDVEGGEYDILPAIDLHALGVKVFAIQMHHNRGVASAQGVIADLDAHDYEPVAILPVVKLTFIRRDLLRH
jgi:FkbM family methyltransferase